MAVQIYNKTFYANGNIFYDNKEDIHKRAVDQVNEFFIQHDRLDVINTIEDWSADREYLRLTVYYKDYI